MRNLKKFLALVLAMMMAFSLMVTANAANANVEYPDFDSVTEEFKEAVDVLAGMGIMTGDNGNFYPDRGIMRSEMAAILYRLMTGDTNQLKNQLYADIATERFEDVNSTDWFAPYIGWCYDAGLMVGSNGYVRPWANVTGYETLVMVLRAMGYGKNGEYIGAQWSVNASSDGTLVGLLKDVKNTHYANTLSANTRRDVVASIVFQAAQLPTVTYTPSLGYNKYIGVAIATGGNILNPSLGEKNFGLASYTGAIVGNEATGEAYTLLGMKAKGVYEGASPKLTKVEIQNGQVSYYHGTSNKAYSASTTSLEEGISTTNPTGNIMLAFNFDTGLDYFGHKATVWFDNRTSGGAVAFGDGTDTVNVPSAYGKTYAVIDKANLVKTVWADDLKTNGKSATAGKTSVYTAAVAAGFNKNYAPAVESAIFNQFTPIAANAATQSKVGMYRIISNESNLAADVVISLNQEVAIITQVNTTIKDGEYIYLGEGNSKFGDELVSASGKKGLLLFDQLSASSDKTLGDLVTANQVVGTAYGLTADGNSALNAYGTTPGTNAATDTPYKDGAGTAIVAAPTNTEDMLYDTAKLEPAFTGTIATYTLSNAPTNSATNHVVNVTMTDGKSYELSGITGAALNTDDTATVTVPYAWAFDGATHLIDNALTALLGNNTSAGVTYTFYLDEVGRFIGVGIPNDYEFLYATFADYEIGSLGTGTSAYYIYGVDWNGNIVKTNNKLSSIELPLNADGGFNFALCAKANYSHTASGAYVPAVPGGAAGTAGWARFSGTGLATGYNALPVTSKNQGNVGAGNQIWEGSNTRFALNDKGSLNWFANGGKFGTRFVGYNKTAGVDDGGSTTVDTLAWTITANDAKNGFARVYAADGLTSANQNAYLLTDDTKFIVVTGSGTADLDVKIYNGLTELVGDSTSTVIGLSYVDVNNTGAFVAADDYIGGDNVYFLTSDQRYGNVNTSDNATIDTVILSDTNLAQYTQKSLYFSGPGNAATGVKLAGDPGWYGTVNQYKLYSGGKADYYWISDTYSSESNANGTANEGDFYRLTPIGEINGQTVYQADLAVSAHATYDEAATNTNSAGCNVNWKYDYVVISDLSTAEISSTGGADKVFKVAGATVTQVFGDNQSGVDTNFPYGVNITDIQTLNNAVSMGKAGASGNYYDINIAFVYNGINVVDIYVTNITLTT